MEIKDKYDLNSLGLVQEYKEAVAREGWVSKRAEPGEDPVIEGRLKAAATAHREGP